MTTMTRKNVTADQLAANLAAMNMTRPAARTLRPVAPFAADATVTTELVKGYDALTVRDASGAVLATAHVVQVKVDIYSIKVGGAWVGNMLRTDVIALFARLGAR